MAGEKKSELRSVECLHLRDCYAQVRAIGRLLGQLEDDLGDVSNELARVEVEDERKLVEQSQDAVTRAIKRFDELQLRLQALSHRRAV